MADEVTHLLVGTKCAACKGEKTLIVPAEEEGMVRRVRCDACKGDGFVIMAGTPDEVLPLIGICPKASGQGYELYWKGGTGAKDSQDQSVEGT